MSQVKGFFEAELPFWLCMNDGVYGILIDGKPCLEDGKPWQIHLSNDKWLIEMGNSLDGQQELVAITTLDDAKKFDTILSGQPYYHKTKMRTVLEMRWGWEIQDGATIEDAKKKMKKEWNWSTQSFIKSVNRFIEIYRTSGIEDKIPTALDTYDLSFNMWHTLFLDDVVIERTRLGLDAYPVIRNPPLKVDAKIQKEIAEKLQTDYSPPSWLLTIENALSLHRRGEYRMAVIEMYTGFEVFMIDFIRKKYIEKGYDETLVEYLMNKIDLNNLLDNGLKLSTGKSFSDIDNSLWSSWANDKGVRRLRHDIIHKGKILVLKEESDNAIKVIGNMIKTLKPGVKGN